AVLDADRVVDDLRERRQAVRRAGGVGDDVVLLAVVGVEVHAEDDGHVLALGGRRDHHLLRARVEVLRSALAVGEEARRLDHDVDAEVAPRQRSRVALGQHLELLAVHEEAAVRRLHLAWEPPEDRVVLEQLSERRRVRDVVDGDPLDIGLLRRRGAKHVAPDAAEAVDSHAYWHGLDPTYEAPLTTSTRYPSGSAMYAA